MTASRLPGAACAACKSCACSSDSAVADVTPARAQAERCECRSTLLLCEASLHKKGPIRQAVAPFATLMHGPVSTGRAAPKVCTTNTPGLSRNCQHAATLHTTGQAAQAILTTVLSCMILYLLSRPNSCIGFHEACLLLNVNRHLR